MNPNERDALVDQVVTEIYDAYPWLWAEFGQHGRERTKEDNYHHIDHLYTAYEMKSADFFLDYTLWLQNVEEKEKLEEAIEQNNRLSAPFIELTKDTALVPLFGDLTSDKMQAVEDYLLKASQKRGDRPIVI
ncbi:hypothetical protein [Halobacillus andaensis]|uniref:hypothetical protein n=1 Tax=Halobacillus andaensis TaxID=1176239 RepID=UPI003D718CF2